MTTKYTAKQLNAESFHGMMDRGAYDMAMAKMDHFIAIDTKALETATGDDAKRLADMRLPAWNAMKQEAFDRKVEAERCLADAIAQGC